VGGLLADKTTTIVGSNLQVNADNTDNGQININSQNFNILSSQDTSNTKSSIKHKNFNVSYTRYMARIQVEKVAYLKWICSKKVKLSVKVDIGSS
jgi:hypothetical protein